MALQWNQPFVKEISVTPLCWDIQYSPMPQRPQALQHKREDGEKSLQGLLLLLYPSPWNELDLDLKTSSKKPSVIRPQD